jgi:hypothetical protein
VIISFEDAHDLYSEMTFAKCILAKCCSDAGQEYEVLTTIGEHPDLGHLVIVNNGLGVELISEGTPAFKPHRAPSLIFDENTPLGELQSARFQDHEHRGEESLQFAATKAGAAGVFEIVRASRLDEKRKIVPDLPATAGITNVVA